MNSEQESAATADDAAGTDDDPSASSQTAGSGGAGTAGRGGNAEELRGWFGGRVPGDWFTAPPDIQVDREEVTIVGGLPAPDTAGASEAERAAAAEGRIRRLRAAARGRRTALAREA